MSERQLRTMLESSASEIDTGAVPLVAIERRARGRRARRRRITAAAVVAVVGAVTAVGLAQDGDDVTPDPAVNVEQLDLPTSEWRPGDDGMDAGIPGVLRLDENDCVYLGGTDPKVPRRQPVVWPADYSAALVAGELVLYDADGEAVAVEGDELSMGGGYLSPQSQHLCATGTEVAYVQSEVEVVGHREATRAELELPTSDWEEGDRAMLALAQGELHVDFEGCLRLGDPLRPEQAVSPIWPKGYTAAVEDDRLTLYDATGLAVAHDGDTVSAGGGSGAPPKNQAQPCTPPRGEVFYVQSKVTVTEPARR